MSAVFKLNRGKNRSLSATAISVVLGLLAILFLVRFGQELLLEQELNGRAAIQARNNAALQDENTRLRAGLQYYQSTKYIEQRAREDLNLRRSDEEVLIPVGLDATAGNNTQAGTTPGAEGEAGQSQEAENWQRWFGLFAPPQAPEQLP